MPNVLLQIPDSDWAGLEVKAKREGIPTRAWVRWRAASLLKAEAELPLPPRSNLKPEEQAA